MNKQKTDPITPTQPPPPDAKRQPPPRRRLTNQLLIALCGRLSAESHFSRLFVFLHVVLGLGATGEGPTRSSLSPAVLRQVKQVLTLQE